MIISVNDWNGLQSVINGTYQEGTELEINFLQAFTVLTTAFNINLPATVSKCTITGVNSSTQYTARITTNRTSYFQLVLNNLNLVVPDNNPAVDIAKADFVIMPRYNGLYIKGNCTINNIYPTYVNEFNTCGIYVAEGTGLYITVENSSVLDIKGLRTYSAPIGGRRDGGSGIMYIQGFDVGGIAGYGVINITTQNNCKSALIGGGGSEFGPGGDSQGIVIPTSIIINLRNDTTPSVTRTVYGAFIGGGGSENDPGGNSEIIDIFGTSKINIFNNSMVLGAFIGSGGSYHNGIGGTSNRISIFGNSIVNIQNDNTINDVIVCGAGIGGGGNLNDGSGGNSNYINISGNAQVNINNIGGIGTSSMFLGALIGSGSFYMSPYGAGGFVRTIEILDSADVKLLSEFYLFGSAIGQGHIAVPVTIPDITINTTGTVDISVEPFDIQAPAIAIGGGDSVISALGGLNKIKGAVIGNFLTISNQFVTLDELSYKTSLTINKGAIVVKDVSHTPLPADRGDYYVITLLEADGVTPYTNPVQLRGEIENNVAQSLITDITPNADGTIRIYLSSGSYYFSSPDNNLKTRNFSVTSNISHNPALSLAMTDGGLASFSGLIWIDANKNGIDDFNENVQAGAVVSLFNVSTNTITNSAITDSNGIFLISNVDAGEYYIVAGNIPLDYVFEDISSSSVTATGISRIAYTVSGTDEVNGINIPIIFNVGARGPQGAPGEFFSSNNINMFNPDLMTAYKNMQVNLGRVASGNGNEIYYSPADNSIILGAEGIYMVNFKANAHFINAMDYMALQVEFAGYMIEQGLAYTNNEGTLTTNLCIDTRKYYGNKLQIINVSNDDFMIDNLTMTIFRMA